MFTGIIESVGIVKRITPKGQDALMEIDTPMDLTEVLMGDSIAVSGACLTVIDIMERSFVADVSAETLSKTILNKLKVGDKVNLEKALRLNSFLGGHLVLGHVDGIGKIRERVTKSNSIIFSIEVDKELSRYIVQKGSVTIDGISLTVNRCEKNRFYVNIIPHTAQGTTLEFRKVGNEVNIETDIIGKYVEKLLNPEKEIDMDFLAEHGFQK